MTAVDPARRFTRRHPCPICGGSADLPQHQGIRCYGFLSADGDYAHCTREEHAPGLAPSGEANTYAHRLRGSCRCGTEHGWLPGAAPLTLPAPTVDGNVQRWAYVDDDGQVIAYHCRRNRADGTKAAMWWENPDGSKSNGAIKPATLPLYGRHTLAQAPTAPVLLVEGERCVDAAVSAGFVAVSLAGGAGQTDFGDALAPLAGRTVVLTPDNDKAGRELMERAGAHLRGKAAAMRWATLPGLADAEDIADYLRRHDARDLAGCMNAAPAWPAETEQRNGVGASPVKRAADLLARVLPEPRMAVPGLLPEGLIVLAGRPKMGKSWLTLGLGIAISAGGYALGTIEVEPGEALILALEDGERRLQSRFAMLLRGDPAPSGLYYETEWPRLDKGGIARLDGWLAEHPACRFVAIDTLAKIRPRRTSNQQGYTEDYSDAEQIQQLAQKYRVAIVLVTHTRKAGADDFIDEVSGTLGLAGGADAILVLQRERGRMDATLRGTGRDLTEDIDLALIWERDPIGWRAVGAGDDYRRSAERQAIRDFMIQHGEPLSPKDVADMLQKPYGPVKYLMWQMAKAGDLRSYGGRYVVLESPRSNEAPHESRPLTSATALTANPLTRPEPDSEMPKNGSVPSSWVSGLTEASENGLGRVSGGLVVDDTEIESKVSGVSGLGQIACSRCGEHPPMAPLLICQACRADELVKLKQQLM